MIFNKILENQVVRSDINTKVIAGRSFIIRIAVPPKFRGTVFSVKLGNIERGGEIWHPLLPQLIEILSWRRKFVIKYIFRPVPQMFTTSKLQRSNSLQKKKYKLNIKKKKRKYYPLPIWPSFLDQETMYIHQKNSNQENSEDLQRNKINFNGKNYFSIQQPENK